MRAAHLAVPLMAMALTGCRPAAEIQAPPRVAVVESGDRRLDCYRIMSVRFHNGYQAGSFHARLDGKDITDWFTPPHNPGGLSHAVMSGPFTGGENPSSSSYNHHTIETNGACVAGHNCRGDDAVRFRTLALQGKLGVSTAPNFSAGSQVPAEVIAPIIPPASLQVEVKPTNNVALYNPFSGIWYPGGQSIFLTLPNNNDRVAFMLRGSPGNYKLEFHSPGCQIGMLGGYINS